MIDFGGSYTPGWIDEELADTAEGDDMATGKIVKGLEDPIEMLSMQKPQKVISLIKK